MSLNVNPLEDDFTQIIQAGRKGKLRRKYYCLKTSAISSGSYIKPDITSLLKL
jgi:hypothetical protein